MERTDATPTSLPREDSRRFAATVCVHLAAIALWVGCSVTVVPRVIRDASQGRSIPALNRALRGGTHRSVEVHLGRWHARANAITLAWLSHLLVMLAVRALNRSPRGETERTAAVVRGWNRRIVTVSALFLMVASLGGARQDYNDHLLIWGFVLSGINPWWNPAHVTPGVNTYGPLFNALAVLTLGNPLAPKILYCVSYVVFLLYCVNVLLPRRLDADPASPPPSTVLLLSPFFAVEIAWYGHFDILVALATVAAVHFRLRRREWVAGACLGAGFLLKFAPILLLPFLAFEGRRFRWRTAASGLLTCALGMGVSCLLWGKTTFRPLVVASMRSSEMLSVFRFLRGRFSPLRLVVEAPNLDRLAAPCLLCAGLLTFVVCRWRRKDLATSSLAALLVTLVFYRVGYPQYQIVLYGLAVYWYCRDPGILRSSPGLALALGLYLGWLALFDMIYVVIGTSARWSWFVSDLAGLPTFGIGLVLWIRLLTAGRSKAAGTSPLAIRPSRALGADRVDSPAGDANQRPRPMAFPSGAPSSQGPSH